MRLTRIFSAGPLQAGVEIALSQNAAHHIARVLRLRAGESLIVFDGSGGEYQAEIVSLAGDRVTVRTGAYAEGIGESQLNMTLIQGISRGERMDWTLQKATELGVSRIAPVLTSRSVVKLDDKQAEKKQEHWRAIVVGACEQSGRTRIPEMAPVRSLNQYLREARGDGLRLALSPNAQESLTALNQMPKKIELLIGPEGGLDEDELSAALQAGFTAVRLGPRVLRTETAAIVALATLQALWGDLR